MFVQHEYILKSFFNLVWIESTLKIERKSVILIFLSDPKNKS